jgi:hypothetical protein
MSTSYRAFIEGSTLSARPIHNRKVRGAVLTEFPDAKWVSVYVVLQFFEGEEIINPSAGSTEWERSLLLEVTTLAHSIAYSKQDFVKTMKVLPPFAEKETFVGFGRQQCQVTFEAVSQDIPVDKAFFPAMRQGQRVTKNREQVWRLEGRCTLVHSELIHNTRVLVPSLRPSQEEVRPEEVPDPQGLGLLPITASLDEEEDPQAEVLEIEDLFGSQSTQVHLFDEGLAAEDDTNPNGSYQL